MHQLMDAIVLLRSVIARHKHAASYRESQEDVDDQVVKRSCGAYGSHRLASRELSYDDYICGVEQELEYP